MYVLWKFGAILVLFILSVHCDNGANYYEAQKFYVPSAPRNLTVNHVSSDTIHLSWSPPAALIRRDPPPPSADGALSDAAATRDRREVRNHRHRKRRQGTNDTEDMPKTIDRVTRIAYVLYYEQGVARSDAPPVVGVPSPETIKNTNVFPSNLGIDDYKATRNLTLRNNAGLPSKVLAFRLKNLRSFTPYKIWVRAFYNLSLEGVQSSDLIARLGASSDRVYALTDVRPPTAPVVLNLTCDQTNGLLYLQWRQPMVYDNSLDHYVVTLRRPPELKPRTRLTLQTNRNDVETTISVEAELWNITRYEVKIYASSMSVAKNQTYINGSEAPPEEVSSETCSVHSAAYSPDAGGAAAAGRGGRSVALLTAAPALLLAAVGLLAVYCRCRSRLSKCISAAYSYLEEGGERGARAPLNTCKKPVVSTTPAALSAGTPEAALARPPRMCHAALPALPRARFAAHVARLHQDSDVGFSKEYEIVVTKSAQLAHTSHYSHMPENRQKNRYLNITAYDHSRVCVSYGGRCSAAGCAGAGAGVAGAGAGAGTRGPCDYVNANFIDGILPELDEERKEFIRKKIERRNRPKPAPVAPPPPPDLSAPAGIESAFLQIEFSGIVPPDDEDSDDGDDVTVDIDGVPTRAKLEWLLWPRRYIATQGPTPGTLPAFWRMVWQHRVRTLVMITNLVERGRRKCDMYWPGGGRGSSATFGDVRVTLRGEDVRAAYTVRTMRAQLVAPSDGAAGEPPRTITQYHYTMWPDHGAPRHPLAVLPFVRAAARDAHTQLVHCSAGVGRTGTYIVLDAQLNQLKLTNTLSPLGFLCRARTQRNHLVQTEEQYIFVHDALLEYVRSGDTEIDFERAREYLVKLLQPISEDELAVLDLSSGGGDGKSVNDLTNGCGEDGASLKSHVTDDSPKQNGGSRTSIMADGSGSDVTKTVNGDAGSVDGATEESEGMYDLAPRNTDTYSKKMQTYNNLSESEKEEIRRANRAENYAILERMRSLSGRAAPRRGPPPANLLEKQHYLISLGAWAEASAVARAAHNAAKNPPRASLPADAARVLLLPKPGVEGSEYINAAWVCGRRRLREYVVAARPAPATRGDVWRMLWDHTAQLLLCLGGDEDCEVFWPTEDDPELFIANFKASYVSRELYVAHRKEAPASPPPAASAAPAAPAAPSAPAPAEPEINGLKRQESDCADDELLIPEGSPTPDADGYKFDRADLKLERLSAGSRDLSARKSIANGDLFSSFSEARKSGAKSPRSPSKMSLKNFKLGSPTKVKFEWGRAGAPPETPPPPPPPAPPTVEEEAESRRPCYRFERVDDRPADVPSDRVIEVTNVSVHSLQDDYQLSVKFIRCRGWLEGDTTEYTFGDPDANDLVKGIREARDEAQRDEVIDRLVAPYVDSFALVEFVAGCQMEYKNGPVVVVDEYGGSRAMNFCTLSGAGAAAADAAATTTAAAPEPCDLYRCAALGALARVPPAPHDARAPHTPDAPHSAGGLLTAYAALVAYARLVALRYPSVSQKSES